MIARLQVGQPLSITFERDGRVQQGSLTFNRSTNHIWDSGAGLSLLATRVLQLVPLSLAIILLTRPTGLNGKLASWLLGTIGVFCTALPARFQAIWGDLPLPLGILLFVPLTSTVVVGALLFAFLATFLNSRWTLARLGLYLLPFGAVVAWEFAFIVSAVYRPTHLATTANMPYVVPIIAGLNAAYVAAGLALLLRNYGRLQDPNERRKVRLLVFGTIVGTACAAPAVTMLWLGGVGGPTSFRDPPPIVQLAYSAFLIMPLTFWWAIGRHKLYDIQFVVRRGIQYLFARRALIVAMPVMLVALAVDGSRHEHQSAAAILASHRYLYLFIVCGGIVFQLKRDTWLEQLDRHFFRERYDACQLLRAVVAKTRVAEDFLETTAFAAEQINGALHLEFVAVYVRNAGEDLLRPLKLASDAEAWPSDLRLLGFVRTLHTPLEIDLRPRSWLRAHLPEQDISFLRRARVSLIVPVVASETGPDVLLVLGTKKSEEPFSREDKNLLQGIAESLAELVPRHQGDLGSTLPQRAHEPLAWDDSLRLIADAVAAGNPVDWASAESSFQSDRQQRFLRELKMMERMLAFYTTPAPNDGVVADALSSGPGPLPEISRWGSFELLECIGRGSLGTVYRSRDSVDREVAVKVLRETRSDRTVLLDEAKRLARVRHPNVVHVYGAGEADGRVGFWMELIAGDTLEGILATQGPFGAEEAATIGKTLCDALAAVHRSNLIHQDVKAENVMRERGTRAGRYVLMDFGAALPADVAPRWGTLAYMAPELFEGGSATFATDIYSLAVLLFHLVTNDFPVSGHSFDEFRAEHLRGRRRWLRDVRPGLTARFVETVDRALSPDADARFVTAGDMAHALQVADA